MRNARVRQWVETVPPVEAVEVPSARLCQASLPYEAPTAERAEPESRYSGCRVRAVFGPNAQAADAAPGRLLMEDEAAAEKELAGKVLRPSAVLSAQAHRRPNQRWLQSPPAEQQRSGAQRPESRALAVAALRSRDQLDEAAGEPEHARVAPRVS